MDEINIATERYQEVSEEIRQQLQDAQGGIAAGIFAEEATFQRQKTAFQRQIASSVIHF